MSSGDEFLQFKLDDKDYNCRKIALGDYSAIREAIRRNRVKAMSNDRQVAIAASQPITSEELMDYFTSLEGVALVLYRCVHDVNEKFSKKDADRMAMEDHPFIRRLFVESGIISDPTSADSEKDSSN